MREAGVQSELILHDAPVDGFAATVFPRSSTGGPDSVREGRQGATHVFELGVPVLGVCYGMQYPRQGVRRGNTAAPVREYGIWRSASATSGLLAGLRGGLMNHNDSVTRLPEIVPIARRPTARLRRLRTINAGSRRAVHASYAYPNGMRVENFRATFAVLPATTARRICARSWSRRARRWLRRDRALSGGVDSSSPPRSFTRPGDQPSASSSITAAARERVEEVMRVYRETLNLNIVAGRAKAPTSSRATEGAQARS